MGFFIDYSLVCLANSWWIPFYLRQLLISSFCPSRPIPFLVSSFCLSRALPSLVSPFYPSGVFLFLVSTLCLGRVLPCLVSSSRLSRAFSISGFKAVSKKGFAIFGFFFLPKERTAILFSNAELCRSLFFFFLLIRALSYLTSSCGLKGVLSFLGLKVNVCCRILPL